MKYHLFLMRYGAAIYDGATPTFLGEFDTLEEAQEAGNRHYASKLPLSKERLGWSWMGGKHRSSEGTPTSVGTLTFNPHAPYVVTEVESDTE